MAQIPEYGPKSRAGSALHNGDCISQLDFHRLYENMPNGFQAELIDGIVYVKEPVGQEHGDQDVLLASIFGAYRAATPGVQASSNVTVILGQDDEVQPDLLLRIKPGYQGQSRDIGPYIAGAPELVAEIAYSSYAIDLHVKRKRYARAGVSESLVVCLQPREIHWFDLASNSKLVADSSGILRSSIFPGLWLSQQSLLGLDHYAAMEILNHGLSSAEHEDFCLRLAQRSV